VAVHEQFQLELFWGNRRINWAS